MSPVDKLILEMGKNPGKFTIDRHELIWEGANGKIYSIWISNGLWFYSGYSGTKASFSFMEKIKIHFALKRLNNHKLMIGLL